MYPLEKKKKHIKHNVNTIILSAPNPRTGGHQVEPLYHATMLHTSQCMHFQRLVYYRTYCHVVRNNENGKIAALSVHVSGKVFGQIM